MDGKTAVVLLSIVLQIVHLQSLVTTATLFQPTVEIITGHSTVFTGDTVRLRCNAPATPYKSNWTYNWFHGPRQLYSFTEQMIIMDIKTQDKGKYYCKGFRETRVKNIPTPLSLPVEIDVHGGWAILDAPAQGVVGFSMSMTCRVRGNRHLSEVMLLRDGVEVLKVGHPRLTLDNVTLEDQGSYICIASWILNGQTYSVISAPVPVQVVEPLTQPTLVIVDDWEMRSLSRLKLVCVLDYNIPDPAPPVLHYFYVDDQQQGTPTSYNFTIIRRFNGAFRCKVKVTQLGLSRWSEPVSFNNGK